MPSPCQKPGDDGRKCGNRGDGEVVIRGCRPSPVSLSQGKQIEEQCDYNQRDREVHQDYVLRVAGEKNVSKLEGVHGYFTMILPVIFGCTEQ